LNYYNKGKEHWLNKKKYLIKPTNNTIKIKITVKSMKI